MYLSASQQETNLLGSFKPIQKYPSHLGMGLSQKALKNKKQMKNGTTQTPQTTTSPVVGPFLRQQKVTDFFGLKDLVESRPHGVVSQGLSASGRFLSKATYTRGFKGSLVVWRFSKSTFLGFQKANSTLR